MKTTSYTFIEDLVSDIEHYIEYLEKEQGLKVTLHLFEPHLRSVLERLLKYNYHSCALCIYAKQSFPLWKHCIERQRKVLAHTEVGPYYGMCWVGVSEFIFPVNNFQGNRLMFICVSGYADDEVKAIPRMKSVAQKYNLNFDEMYNIFIKHMNHDIPNMTKIQTLISPLSWMITVLIEALQADELSKMSPGVTSSNIFANLIRYIQQNYSSAISLDSLSQIFNCSPSYLSHIFNENAGCSLPQYINRQRMEYAKQYLVYTQMSIQEISYALGYNDSNYFSSIFSAFCGTSPREWRKLYGNTRTKSNDVKHVAK